MTDIRYIFDRNPVFCLVRHQVYPNKWYPVSGQNTWELWGREKYHKSEKLAINFCRLSTIPIIPKVLDGISRITKSIIFFPIWRPVRGKKMIFVCSYGCVEGPAGVWGPAWQRPLPPFSLYKPVFNKTHYTSVRTHKNQSFSSHRPSNGKKLCFS